MGFIQGEGRTQGTLFPVTLDDLIPEDHVCRVIDAFVSRLEMEQLGFLRAEAAETGRPGYDPRDLLKLYLYGYLQQVRSSRRLEAECQRNVEVMWLLGRLRPDHKSIAEFRRLHRDAVVQTGAELIAFARSVGLVKGEWIAIDGSKFRAVSSQDSVHERLALERYLERLEVNDAQDEPVIDVSAVASALEKLRLHAEPEVGLMHTTQGEVPAYNVQTAVDAEHSLIVVQQVTNEANDTRSLLPMAEAAQVALGKQDGELKVIADAGYSNGEQASACEARGILPHLPANRGSNKEGDGTLFAHTRFQYQQETDTMLCPAGQHLQRRSRKGRSIQYEGKPEICGVCPLKLQCTVRPRRMVKRHLYDVALQRMHARATPQVMRLRSCLVEHPFAIIKHYIFGHPRFLLRGLKGAQTEIGLAVMVYNLKRMFKVLGGAALRMALVTA